MSSLKKSTLMKNLSFLLSIILGLATSVSSANVDYVIYVTNFSFSADEKWYLAGACESANPNYSIRFTDFSFRT